MATGRSCTDLGPTGGSLLNIVKVISAPMSLVAGNFCRIQGALLDCDLGESGIECCCCPEREGNELACRGRCRFLLR